MVVKFTPSVDRWISWLVAVLIGTGIAGYRAQLPGSELRPYILRFDEDKPNPLYRRVCYTFAWNAILNFALMNLIGLVIAVINGRWYMSPIYHYAYLPVCALILILGFAGLLPRVMRSTKGEGHERRYFYGSVWAVTAAQTVLLVLWKTLPRTSAADWTKLAVYLGVLALMGWFAYHGKLPRTRPIVPGAVINVRPIGVLKMVDDGGGDADRQPKNAHPQIEPPAVRREIRRHQRRYHPERRAAQPVKRLHRHDPQRIGDHRQQNRTGGQCAKPDQQHRAPAPELRHPPRQRRQ